MDLPIPKKLLKSNFMMIANMREVKVKITSKRDELFKILKKNVKKTYNESPFKSIIFGYYINFTKNRMQKNKERS